MGQSDAMHQPVPGVTAVNHITAILRADHDRLTQLATEFRLLVARTQPPPGIDLVKFRTAFSKEMLAHLAREDMLLYPALGKSPDPQVARIARSFVDEMGGLMSAYKEWSIRWPTELAVEYWPTFVHETTELLDMLATRIMRENNSLYPLVETVPVEAP